MGIQPKDPFVCAEEGETCACTGTVYYGDKTKTFNQLKAGIPTSSFARESALSIHCAAAVFGPPAGLSGTTANYTADEIKIIFSPWQNKKTT